MKNNKPSHLLRLAFMVLGSNVAWAQTGPVLPTTGARQAASSAVQASSTAEREVVRLYYDCGFAGTATLGLVEGDALTARDSFFDLASLSSVGVDPGYEVVLYDGENFTGSSITLTQNTRCLVDAGWNDRTSSIKVRRATSVPSTGGDDIFNFTDVEAFFYSECDFVGFPGSGLDEGAYTSDQLRTKLIRNNDISSLRVRSGYEVVLYDGDNFTGPSITINSSTRCLPRNWNNRATSLRVRPATPAPSVALTVAPNPTTGTVSLTGLRSFPATVGIYDGQGLLRKTVQVTQPSPQVQVDFSELQSGLYLIRVEDSQGVRTGRLEKR